MNITYINAGTYCWQISKYSKAIFCWINAIFQDFEKEYLFSLPEWTISRRKRKLKSAEFNNNKIEDGVENFEAKY